jgi:hypothetical protein
MPPSPTQHQGRPDSTQPGVIRGHEDARLPRADLRRADLPGHPEAGVPVRRLSRSRRRSRTSLTARQHGRTRGINQHNGAVVAGRARPPGHPGATSGAAFCDLPRCHDGPRHSGIVRNCGITGEKGAIVKVPSPARAAVQFQKTATQLHRILLQSPLGRVASALPGPQFLLLHTTGRELGTTPPHAAVVHEGRRRVRGDRIQRRCAEAPRLVPQSPGDPSGRGRAGWREDSRPRRHRHRRRPPPAVAGRGAVVRRLRPLPDASHTGDTRRTPHPDRGGAREASYVIMTCGRHPSICSSTFGVDAAHVD